jgi:hypothetical protein
VLMWWGLYKLTHSLKAPGFNPYAYKVCVCVR